MNNTDNLDFIKIKNFCFLKDAVRRIKRKASTERNYCKLHIQERSCIQYNCKKTIKILKALKIQ